MECSVKVGGIMHCGGLTMIGVLAMPSGPGLAGTILSTLGRHDINVQFVVQLVDKDGFDHVVFCIGTEDLERTLDLLADVKEQVLAQKIVHENEMGLVGIFGPDFRQRPGIAGQMFWALGQAGINIKAISTSMSTCSCLIDEARVADAVKALENAFELP